MPSDRPDDYADKLLQDAVLMVSGGYDPTAGAELNQTALDLLKEHLAALKGADFKAKQTVTCQHCGKNFRHEFYDVAALTKSFGQLMKAVDINARLVNFTQGKPDSRPQFQGMDWLQALTAEQLATVQGWIQENARVAEGQE